MIPNAATETSKSRGAACATRPAAYLTPTDSGLRPHPHLVQLAAESVGMEAMNPSAVRVERLRPVQEDDGHLACEDLLNLIVDLLPLLEVGHLRPAQHQLVDRRIRIP